MRYMYIDNQTVSFTFIIMLSLWCTSFVKHCQAVDGIFVGKT